MAIESFPIDGAILGAIMLCPDGHGYALRNWLSTNLSPIWRIAPSRIYSTLARMERDGLIRGTTVPQAGRPPRRTFHITPAGQDAFWKWAMTPVRHLRDVRVEFLAKLYFLHRLAPERTAALVTAEITVLERTRSRLARRRQLKVGDVVIGRLARTFRLGQLQATLDWLHDCSTILKEAQ